MALSAQPFTRTIDRQTIAEIAKHFRTHEDRYTGRAERDRMILAHPEIETADDFLLVTIAIDVIPETELTLPEINDVASRESLVAMVLDAYRGEAGILNCFRIADVDRTVVQFKVDRRDIGMVPGENSTPDMDYETTSAEMEKIMLGSTVADPTDPTGFTDMAREYGKYLHDGAMDVVDPVNRAVGDDLHEAFFNGKQAIMDENFFPDTIVAGDLDAFDNTLEGHFNKGHFYDTTVHRDMYLGNDRIFLVDSDHFGYECVWRDMELEIENHIPRRLPDVDTDVGSNLIRGHTYRNWVAIYPEAIVELEVA